jgi:hypothetical protein
VLQQDLANNVMDQKKTSGEFGLPTSTERAFLVHVDYFRVAVIQARTKFLPLHNLSYKCICPINSTRKQISNTIE